jgi:hypothetical protein
MGGKHLLDYITAAFAFAAAVGGVWAVIAATRQASIAGDTERRQLRAYVYMYGITIEAMRRMDDGDIMWQTEASWRNSGATPTRGLKVLSKVGARYAKGETISLSNPFPLSLGPGDQALVFGANVQTSKISSFTAEGIAVYRDAFGHDRVTMACRSANAFNREDLNEAKVGDKIQLDSLPCGNENCADEDCKSYRDLIGDSAPTSAYDP